MIPCSSCGYQFDKSQLREIAAGSYCRVCVAIGGSKVNQNPHQFGEARYFLPALGYCTNLLMAAISTRAGAGENEPEGREVFLVLSPVTDKDGVNDGPSEFVEFQTREGKSLNAPFENQKIAGTNFIKWGPLMIPRVEHD